MSRGAPPWYNAASVHAVERAALPEWFDGSSPSKTPTVYMQLRQFVIESYCVQPSCYLSATECRRHVAVDVSAVLRLHEFLEHWGLINSSVTAHHPVPAGVAPVAGCDVAGDSEAWDSRETLALIEALESIAEGGTWEDVSAKLGRSADACMQQLMRTPIEMPRADALSEAEAPAAADPLLCQLGLLASAVGVGKAESGSGGAAPTMRDLGEAATGALLATMAKAKKAHGQQEAAMAAVTSAAAQTQRERLDLKLDRFNELAACLRQVRTANPRPVLRNAASTPPHTDCPFC